MEQKIINCVLMCGGIGSRLNANYKIYGKNIEKPLVPLNRKPLIQYIIETILGLNREFRLFAAVSSNTKKTEEFINSKYFKKITIIKTKGNGFSEDFSYIIKYFMTNYQTKEQEKLLSSSSKIIFFPVDLPLVSINTIERISEIKQETPLTSIVIDKKIIEDNGFCPTPYTLRIDEKEYCYTGISVVDFAHISNNIGKINCNQIKETSFIINCPEFAFNINTRDDLKRTEDYIVCVKNQTRKRTITD